MTLDRFLWESQLCCGIFCFLLWHLKAMSRCYCEQCQKVDRIVVYFFGYMESSVSDVINASVP